MSDHDAAAARQRGVARYRQIAEVIREQIRRGMYGVGAQIKSEEELGLEFSVSRTTIRQAIEMLVNDGLLVRRHGRGTFVTAPPRRSEVVLTGSLGELAGASDVFQVVFVNVEQGSASPRVEELLGLPAAEITHVTRLRDFEGMPLTWTETFLPREIGKRLNRKLLQKSSLLLILAEEFGIVFSGAHLSITASHAEPTIAERLGLGVGAPVLDIELVYRADDRPFAVSRSVSRSDRVAYEVELGGLTGAAAAQPLPQRAERPTR